MELKDFVEQTLTQIFDGIKAANEKHDGKENGIINPNLQLGRDNYTSIGGHNYPIREAEFDVALTSTSGTETKGGIGVFLGPVGVGSQGQSNDESTSMTRIKFSVPIAYPVVLSE